MTVFTIRVESRGELAREPSSRRGNGRVKIDPTTYILLGKETVLELTQHYMFCWG
jgi:hypothetical protein